MCSYAFAACQLSFSAAASRRFCVGEEGVAELLRPGELCSFTIREHGVEGGQVI